MLSVRMHFLLRLVHSGVRRRERDNCHNDLDELTHICQSAIALPFPALIHWSEGGTKIVRFILREPGHAGTEMPIDINSDGTLEVPIYGEFKKKGN